MKVLKAYTLYKQGMVRGMLYSYSVIALDLIGVM